jgi:pimeloyl-ACP methyl ester carboxylesterase
MATTSHEPDVSISSVDAEEIASANETGLTPVVFIHGLWLLPSSWDRWAEVFDEAGYRALTPGWPDDPRRSPRGTSAVRSSRGRPSETLPSYTSR